MSDERLAEIRAISERDIGWDSELSEALGYLDALQASYDARNDEVKALTAALRKAREALAAVPRGESWLHLGDDVLASLERIRDDRLAEIDAVLGES